MDLKEFDISIITVNKDNSEGLKRTLASAQKQRVKYREILVVDASNEPEESYARVLTLGLERSKFIRQASKGIYPAMNEGLELASGEWVWFMNAGDEFADDQSIASVSRVIARHSSKVYIGGHSVVDNKNNRVVSEINGYANSKKFAYVLRQINHQSTIYNRDSLVRIGGYDLRWRLCADYASVISIANCEKSDSIFFFSNIISLREPGGVSDSNLIQVQIEKFRIRSEMLKGGHLRSLGWLLLHLGHYFRLKLIRNIQKTIKRI